MEGLIPALDAIDSFMWGPPLITLLVGTGIYLTFRLKLLQVMRQLSSRIRETTEKYVDVCRSVSEHRRTQSELDFYANQYSTFWY